MSVSLTARARLSSDHAMLRMHFTSISRLGLIALGFFGSSVRAQARSESSQAASVADDVTFRVTPQRPDLGSLVLLSFRRSNPRSDSIQSVTGWMAGEPLHFHIDSSGTERAFGAVPLEASDSVVARVILHLTSGAADTLRTVIAVPHHMAPNGVRAARARHLQVSKVFTAKPDSLTEARIERDNARARAVGRSAHATPELWTEPFMRPRASRITSAFGSGRLFNGRLTSSHGGVDFAGQPGDPVRAANRGVVALVDNFFLAGNVVYVNHGGGIVTGYFHLTQATVAVGDTVERGQEIGVVGATGRVTGPHLHWSARYGEHTVDPMGLIELTRVVASKAGRTDRPR